MKEHLPMLKRVLEYIDTSEFKAVAGVYTSPAQRLRQQADELEQRASDFWQLANLIKELESPPAANEPEQPKENAN